MSDEKIYIEGLEIASIEYDLEVKDEEIVRLKAEVVDERMFINDLRKGLDEIYAYRGNDEIIAKICKPLLDRIKC